jgi:CRISPR/Cas system-associated exonuclease Cas4 (RecB family)
MEYFLQRIARALHAEIGNNLRNHCLVFPNRRAGLYFRKYLAAEISKPVWTPSITTINDLFRSLSKLPLAENEILLFELYKVYRRIRKSPESFDDFYFWGDMLINDFDDVDKYLVNASTLFRNVEDIRKIDQQFGGLSPEQTEIIKRFWVNFNPEKQTAEKSEFSRIWSILNDLYNGLKDTLRDKSLGYEGMIFRDVIENYRAGYMSEITWEMFHFIGFNALNECEKALMIWLKKTGKARFYWDYDNSYLKKEKLNSAGFFLKENIRLFGNDMPEDWSFDTLLSKGSGSIMRRIIDTSSDVAQVKLIPGLIEELPDLTKDNAHHTAIVLADENLLMPVLTSLPETVQEVNITMGYPLRQSLVYSLVRSLLDLQRSSVIRDGIILFRYQDVLSILKDPLIADFLNDADNEINKEIISANLIWVPSNIFEKSEHLSKIFIKPVNPALLSDYLKSILIMVVSNKEKGRDIIENEPVQKNIRNEFIYRVILSLNRLDAVANNPDISFTTDTWMRILDRLLRNQSVPFSGEPLSGIQIMGILETRTLDFKNLIILSVNEGILPSVTAGSSFIPFSLREAFGLPSINHQESIYAYHFYRLLQRAENITFVYNSNPEGLRSGEMSRFLQQLKYEPSLKPVFLNQSFEIKTHGSVGTIVERTADHRNQLFSMFFNQNDARMLSPSAINTWLNCRMRFYYRYVNRLKEPDKISADIDPSMLGSFLHETMKNLFKKYVGEVLNTEILNALVTNRQKLAAIIRESIDEILKRSDNNYITGNELIVRDVLMVYLVRILDIDKAFTPFTLLGVEKSYSFRMTLRMPDNTEAEVITGGRIDRIDIKDGVVRIVDYKTGTVSDSINSINHLFADDRKKDPDGWLQTMLYCEAYLAENPELTVRPSIYKIKKLPADMPDDQLRIKPDRNSEVAVDNYSKVRKEFMDGLKETVQAIFGNSEPFVMTSDRWNKCPYCPYRTLCMR